MRKATEEEKAAWNPGLDKSQGRREILAELSFLAYHDSPRHIPVI